MRRKGMELDLWHNKHQVCILLHCQQGSFIIPLLYHPSLALCSGYEEQWPVLTNDLQ